MTKIQNAQGVLSIEVPTGHLLWVDPVNGIDKLATRERLTIPFRTLIAAKSAAIGRDPDPEVPGAGDTIMVLPGEYDERDLLKPGVNWLFFAGAYVNSTESGAIFDDQAYEDGVVCVISGWA